MSRSTILRPVTFLVFISRGLTILANGDGDIELVHETRDRYVANRSLLRNWKGTMVVADSVNDAPAQHTSELVTEVQFVVDVSSRRFAAEAECISSTDVTRGVKRQSFFDGVRHAEIRRDDGFMKLGPFIPNANLQPSGVLTPGGADDRGWASYTQHPLSYFKILETPVEDRLQMYLTSWQNSWFKSKIRKEDSRVTVAELTSKLPDVINTSVFDWEKGGSLIEFHGRDPLIEEDWAFSYERVSGVWMLSELLIQHRDVKSDNKRTRKVVFVNSEVNKGIAESDFSLESVHTPVGTVITDYSKQLVYAYKEAKKQPDKRPSEELPAESSRQIGWGRFWLVVINVVTVVSVVAVYLARRYSDKKSAA